MVKHHVCFCLWLALALCLSEAANNRGQPMANAQALSAMIVG
jgi:hypothetical protein